MLIPSKNKGITYNQSLKLFIESVLENKDDLFIILEDRTEIKQHIIDKDPYLSLGLELLKSGGRLEGEDDPLQSNTLVVYGCKLDERDAHIREALKNSVYTKIYLCHLEGNKSFNDLAESDGRFELVPIRADEKSAIWK